MRSLESTVKSFCWTGLARDCLTCSACNFLSTAISWESFRGRTGSWRVKTKKEGNRSGRLAFVEQWVEICWLSNTDMERAMCSRASHGGILELSHPCQASCLLSGHKTFKFIAKVKQESGEVLRTRAIWDHWLHDKTRRHARKPPSKASQSCRCSFKVPSRSSFSEPWLQGQRTRRNWSQCWSDTFHTPLPLATTCKRNPTAICVCICTGSLWTW